MKFHVESRFVFEHLQIAYLRWMRFTLQGSSHDQLQRHVHVWATILDQITYKPFSHMVCVWQTKLYLTLENSFCTNCNEVYLMNCIFFENGKKGKVILVNLDGKLVEMDPDQTRAYFWPAVNKVQTRLWAGYFLTRLDEIFFDLKGKKLKQLRFLGEIFQIHRWQTDQTQADHQKIGPTWVGSKMFDPDPSLETSEVLLKN